jgi:adenine-specific DNA-methyltransferase
MGAIVQIAAKQRGDTGSPELVEQIEFFRLDAGRSRTAQSAELGQFLTPVPVARFMAKLVEARGKTIRLLDAGAGVGSLAAATIEELITRPSLPKRIELTVCEIDSRLCGYLEQAVAACRMACESVHVEFEANLIVGDFIAAAVDWLPGGVLFRPRQARTFDCVVLNPPYRKISSDSKTRRLLRQADIETTNIYTAFLWLSQKLLSATGEMIAITPRSFCNGPYFRLFRTALLSETSLSHVHIFDSRKGTFDDVLQENIIFRASKARADFSTVITASRGPFDPNDPNDPNIVIRTVQPTDLVRPDDRERVIHLASDELQNLVAERVREFKAKLPQLEIEVSTGRVVDFRARDFLVADEGTSGNEYAPLIYPMHFSRGQITWPRKGRKPNRLRISKETEPLLVPRGCYVLVKRFSAKEEKRRVVAAVCNPATMPDSNFAFENHLNFFHRNGSGLPAILATGLAAYLNSSLLDAYFRQFSGHTQVNASDLRNFPYPTMQALERIGRAIGDSTPSQDQIDSFLTEELSDVAKRKPDPVKARRRIEESLSILKLLGLPRAQQNDRSALTLLALAQIKPDTAWSDAESMLMGITPIMEFAKDYYGTSYAPNTRETFRRQTMHQFVEAGIARYNPDDPKRPVNSPRAVYQITPLLLDVLRTHKTRRWQPALKDWLAQVETLRQRYAKDREMARIPLRLPTGKQIDLSPGGQNVLVEQIIHKFCPRFAPGGTPIYVGDTEKKHAHFDEPALNALGVIVDSHGKMPDIVIHHVERNWLLLIEAVTSHGPVDAKRRDELKRLFEGSSAPLVFVTAFMDRTAMVRFLGEISWETEVWVAEAPSHMIHFNGERFLGPYED